MLVKCINNESGVFKKKLEDITIGKTYEAAAIGLSFEIKGDEGEVYCYGSELFEIVEETKTKTFKQVIENIKEKEKWESDFFDIEKRYEGIIITHKNCIFGGAYLIKDKLEFKLKT